MERKNVDYLAVRRKRVVDELAAALLFAMVMALVFLPVILS